MLLSPARAVLVMKEDAPEHHVSRYALEKSPCNLRKDYQEK